MVKPICKDIIFLGRASKPALPTDMQTAIDLLDTLRANADHCVGMAANMIGEDKRIIAVNDNGSFLVMFNPEITKSSGPYDTEEGCLSLSGTRPTKRFKTITVKYQDNSFKQHTKVFSGWTAQIIQHEIDHCNGKII